MNQKEILEQTYIDHADSLFRFVYFRVFDREVAKDLTQEAFFKVADYLMQGKEIDNMKAFLYKTARNLIINSIRDKKPVSSLDMLHDTINFDIADTQTSQYEQDMAEVAEILESFKILKPHDAEIMQMRYGDGLSVQEISDITKLSENHISVKIHRLLEKLKTHHTQHEKE